MLIPLDSSRFFIFYYIFELDTQSITHYSASILYNLSIYFISLLF